MVDEYEARSIDEVIEKAARTMGITSRPTFEFNFPEDGGADGRATDAFTIHGDTDTVHIRSNSRRGQLYGVYESLARKKRATGIPDTPTTYEPTTEMRADMEFIPQPFRMSPQRTREWIDDRMARLPWFRIRQVAPAQSYGRNFVIYGYPDYVDPVVKKGRGFEYCHQVYKRCQDYGFEFWYTLHLPPLPPESGYLSNCLSSADGNIVQWGADSTVDSEVDLVSTYPEWFDSEGRIDLRHEGLVNLIREELRQATEQFPEMNGVHIYPCECGGHNLDIAHDIEFSSDISYVVEQIRAELDDEPVSVFTHGFPANATASWIEEKGDLKREFGEALSTTDPLLIEEVNFGPQFPGREWYGWFDSDRAKQAYFDRMRSVAWLLADGEHIGRDAVSFVLPDWYSEAVSVSRDLGCAGAAIRSSRGFGDATDGVLSANLHVLSRELWDGPGMNEAPLQEWVETWFATEQSETIRSVLSEHETIWRNVLLLNGLPVFKLVGSAFNNQHLLSDLYGDGIRYPEILELIQPSGTKMKTVLSDVILRLMATEQEIASKRWEKIRSEQDNGIRLAKDGLQTLERLNDNPSDDRLPELRSNQEKMVMLVELTAGFTRCLYHEKAVMHAENPTEQDLTEWVDRLNSLRETTGTAIETYGRNFFYGLPKGLTAYAWTAAGKIEALEVDYEQPISQRLH